MAFTSSTIKRPDPGKVGRCIFAAINVHKIDIKWHSVGRLIDSLIADGHDDVAAWVCETMNRSDRLTRSAFVLAFFQFLREDKLVRKIIDADAAKRRTASRERKRTTAVRQDRRPVRRLRDNKRRS